MKAAKMKTAPAKGAPAKRVQMKYVRWAVLAAVFVVITIGLVLNTNLGTLSSFGWQAIATICPLGALESMLASKSIFLRALIVLAVVVAAVVVFGKFFCAWICPVAPVRSLREIVRKKFAARGKHTDSVGPAADLREAGGEPTPEESSVKRGNASDVGESAVDQLAASDKAGVTPLTAGEAKADRLTADEQASLTSPCASGCASCTTKRPKIDSRHIVLGGSLLSAAIFGFPVFCLLCPIGLIFGTVIIVWQFANAGDLSLSLLIYPVVLVLELLVFRKWCGKLCPMGALVSLVSLTNRFFKPVVNRNECIRARGGTCSICSDVCPEGIDPHCSDGMNECSKCGLCRDACPTAAISFAAFPKRDAYDPIPADSIEQKSDNPLPVPK